MKEAKFILSFVLLVLAQVLVFNNHAFLGYMNPYIYLIYLLYLPATLNRSSLLLIAFALGLCIDMFENTGGIHASATLSIAWLRPILLKVVSQRQGDDLTAIKIRELGLVSTIFYSLSAILVHHFLLFLLEEFSFENMGTIMLRTLYSSTFTFIFVLLIQLWNFKRKD